MYRSPYKIINRKIKFAILGCGRISPKHFEAIQQHSGNAGLVAVCDTDKVVLDDVVKKYKVKGYASLEEMELHYYLDSFTELNTGT